MKHFIENLKKNWKGTISVTIIWLILGWLYSFGIRAVFLIPLNYLTGAITGLEGDNFIGSIIGRTILIIFINGFITSLFLYQGNWKDKCKQAGKHFANSLLNAIPFFKNLRDFDFQNTGSRWLNIAGTGLGLGVYAFITGNGAWINSFVCVAIFLHIMQEIAEKRGILTALLNLIFSKFGKKRISREPVEAIINGFGIGMLLSIIYAFAVGISLYAYIAGGFIFVIGMVVFWIKRFSLRKELIICEEK